MTKEKPRMLVIGSRGFLGRYATRAAAAELTVFEGNRITTGQRNEVRIDIKDKQSVETAFEEVRPDVALLLAANADIDYCQQHPEDAKAVNLDGAGYVAAACARSSAQVLFASSGAVFDGRQHGYTEDSPVSPVSVYGETKARAEKLILALLPDAIVVRLALVIGFAVPPGGNAFLDKLRKRWAAGETVRFPVSEHRNPIDAVSCSRFMLELVKTRQRGIFHIGCTDSISRYELGIKLASRMGYADRVRPELEPTPGRAPRGPDQLLLTDKLSATCATPIPTCDQVIERCFDGVA
jgi:dTDP-4-dehydrorhamnose reductase